MNAFSSEKRYPDSMAFWHKAYWHTNLLAFQGAWPDHIGVESSSCCFPREVVNFDQWSTRKRILLILHVIDSWSADLTFRDYN